MKGFFITGTDTGVGKTVAAGIFAKIKEADYWKPVQAGDLHDTDSHKIARWLPGTTIHPEKYRLQTPASPHYAARLDGVRIALNDFQLPASDKPVVVEGAGGLLVPLNDAGDTMLDLMEHLNLPVVLVSKNYLGSINHTLMSIACLKARSLPIAGLIFNGKENKETTSVILKISKLKCLGTIPEWAAVTPETIRSFAAEHRTLWRNNLKAHVPIL